MSGGNPDISRLELNERSINLEISPESGGDIFYETSPISGPPTPNTAPSRSPPYGYSDKTANYASNISGHTAASPSSWESPKDTTPGAGNSFASDASVQSPSSAASPSPSTHFNPNASSTSVSSQSSQQGRRNGKFLSSKSQSVLELKRFFGKGRTKHEQGIAPEKPREHHRATFSLFGLGKRGKKNTMAEITPSVSPLIALESRNESVGQNAHNHHSILSSNHHHHHHKHHKHDPNKGIKHAIASKNIDPKHADAESNSMDSNFVIHAPDYEADWDPFHVFGLAPNSERLPFLESGITKYGEVGKDMGSGAGGSVRMMARPSDNKMFAVKEFRPRRKNETHQKYSKHVTAEYALGAALHHKNIIETIDLLKEGDRYYEVMEYGPHDYFELVMSGRMTTQQVDSAFKQIVNGVAYLHSMGVAHRDLKLDNCVVTENGVVKIIDFGSAIIFRYSMSSQIHLARGILGSDPYLAPEVFSKEPYQPQVADIWSCGIIYCCSYLRRFPWKLPQDEDPGFKRYNCNPENVDGKHPRQENPRKITGPWRLLRLLPSDTRDVIQRILKVDVKARITTEELVHSFWLEQTEEISVLPANIV